VKMHSIKPNYILSLVILFFITVSSSAQLYLPVPEYKAPKYRSIVFMKSGVDLRGFLLEANSERIILAGFYYSDEVYRYFNKIDTIAIKDIYSITIKDRLSGLKGAWMGFKAGALYGLTQGVLVLATANGFYNNFELVLLTGVYILAPAIIAAPVGALFNPLLSDKNLGGKYTFDDYEISKLMRYTYFNPVKKKKKWN
jgi:hypothetical protein